MFSLILSADHFAGIEIEADSRRIREGKKHRIRNMLQQSSEEYESIDTALARLRRENKISLETGLKFSENFVHFKQCTSAGK